MACLPTSCSQLYLEARVPVLRDVFWVQESFHAGESDTHHPMGEYTHLKS